MTDRELLDLAAKAANMNADNGFFWCQETGDVWNPFTDDADAFRLAVRLKMDVDQGEIGTRHGTPAAVVHYRWMLKSGQLVWSSCAEPSSNNPLSATRRAITRAAAELGKKTYDL